MKNKIFLIFFFLNSLLLALLEILSIGILAIYVGFVSNPDMIIDKVSFQPIKNYLINLDQIDLILKVSLLIVVIFIIKNLAILFSNWFSFRIKQSITSDNSSEIFNFILNSNYQSFQEISQSKLIYKIHTEVKRVGDFIVGYNLFFKEILLIIFLSIPLLLMNKAIFISLMLIFIIIFTILALSIKNILKKIALKLNKHSSLMLKTILEVSENITLIKLSSKNYFFINKYLNQLNLQIKYGNIKRIIDVVPRSIFEVLAVSLVVAFVCFTFYKSNIRHEELISILAFIALMAVRMVPAFSGINSHFSSIIFNEKSFLDFVKNREKIKKNKLDKAAKKILDDEIKLDHLEIKLENLGFYYNSNNFVLKNANFNFEENYIFGVTGKSGSGKSTLIKIIMGLLTPKEGNIYLNNVNITSLKSNWQKMIGYVPQRIFLIDDTIESNVALGEEKSELSNKKIDSCLELSNLKNLINSSNLKKFRISEQGKNLSGGQIQSIGVARALYNNPKILIFDEPTNNLDYESKNTFIQNLKKISKGRIFIIISHDIKLLKNCNKIFKINNKNIYEINNLEEELNENA